MNEEERQAEGEGRALAQRHKAELLEDFPGIEAEMWETAGMLYDLAKDCTVKEVIHKSLLVGATKISARYREAQRIEKELNQRCQTNIQN